MSNISIMDNTFHINDLPPFNDDNDNEETIEHIYQFYKDTLIPALLSSLPLLFKRILIDIWSTIQSLSLTILHFLVPWTRDDFEWTLTPNVNIRPPDFDWIHNNFNFTQFLLRHFDTDNDGHISASELFNAQMEKLPTLLQHQRQQLPNSFTSSGIISSTRNSFQWFQYSFPLMDWKIGLFLWRSCGGLLLLLAIATIIPGKIHGLAGRILRWPILALTYVMITAELIVYVLVRLFIRMAESVFSTKKHSTLRRGMENAKSYTEWYEIAKLLDVSQGRDKWQNTTDDDMSYRYNWHFIYELISDMKKARETGDTYLALTVLQQCTRKNVGGIMSEDLFSFTNTGEPKVIVKKFLEEVVVTLRWLTESVKVNPTLPTSVTKTTPTNNTTKNHVSSTCMTSSTNKTTTSIKKDDNMNQLDKKDSCKTHENKTKDDSGKHLLEHVFGTAMWVMSSFTGDHHHDHHQQQQLQQIPNGKNDSLNKLPPIETKLKDTNTPQTRDTEQQSNNTTNPLDVEISDKLKLQLMHMDQVKTFLKRAKAAYGRTALCLSGGASMGCYHFGHVKALLEEDVLPHIISGTSAGSAIAAMICTRSDEEIMRDLKPEIVVRKLTPFSSPWKDRFRHLREKGCMFDTKDWIELIKWFTCGDLTFEEAYRKTGRVLCITLSATTKKAPPVLVNYITAPNVTIASAVVASTAVPGFLNPMVLQVKGEDGIVRDQEQTKNQTYWDGSIDQDIPTGGLAEMFNCQFFLAAQCNPHIVPFFHNSKGDVGCPSRWSRGMQKDSWKGGFLLAALELYLKSDMRAKFHFLNDLEVAVGFTSTMMTQEFSGTTTIVPRVSFFDYFRLFSNPSLEFLKRCFQVGSVAAYKHCEMVKLHYQVSYALDECLSELEGIEGVNAKSKRKSVLLANKLKMIQESGEAQKWNNLKGYSLSATPFTKLSSDDLENMCDEKEDDTVDSDEAIIESSQEGEYETCGFDGMDIRFVPTRRSSNT